MLLYPSGVLVWLNSFFIFYFFNSLPLFLYIFCSSVYSFLRYVLKLLAPKYVQFTAKILLKFPFISCTPQSQFSNLSCCNSRRIQKVQICSIIKRRALVAKHHKNRRLSFTEGRVRHKNRCKIQLPLPWDREGK